MSGPNGHHLAEIDIEHDAAEIEQQRVGGVGESGEFIPLVYKTGRVPATADRIRPLRFAPPVTDCSCR